MLLSRTNRCDDLYRLARDTAFPMGERIHVINVFGSEEMPVFYLGLQKEELRRNQMIWRKKMLYS